MTFTGGTFYNKVEKIVYLKCKLTQMCFFHFDLSQFFLHAFIHWVLVQQNMSGYCSIQKHLFILF